MRVGTNARRRKNDEDLAPQSLSRKQVLDALRRGRSLMDADLRGTDLSGISFEGVDLQWVKLADANCAQCNFNGANLSGASMWHANLKEATFDNAVLDFADLDETNLDGCTFLGARIKKTIFPNPRVSLPLVEASIKDGSRVMLAREGHLDDE